jgi:4-hydroxybenzoyl-CoA thioesterase
MAYTSVQKIRFDDVDGAGIVYYPRYFHLCHAAFEDFFDAAAPVSYPDLIAVRRRGFPTVKIESDFTAPLAYGDIAVVDVRVEHVGTSSARFRYEIRRKRDGVLAFTASITTVFMDLDARTSTPLTDDVRALLQRLHSSA